MRYVGVDPGLTGAAVCIADDGRTVLHVTKWSTKRARAVPGRAPPLPTLPGLPWLLPTDVVALEAQYVGRSKRGSVALAIWTEHLMRSLPADIVLVRPLATTWRAKVLGKSRLERDVAKRLAIAAAAAPLARFGLDQDAKGDVSEAFCLARFCWGWDKAGRP